MNLSSLNNINISNISTAYGRVILSAQYKPYDRIIKEFLTKYPDNIDLDIISAKLALIDDCFVTNAFRYRKIDINTFATNILKTTNVDKRIEAGDYSVVDDIVRGLHNVSFMIASAFCTLHNRHIYSKDDFFIYSRTNAHLIPAYTRKYPSTTRLTIGQMELFRNKNDYKGYNNVVETFLDQMSITTYDRKKQFDLFLWEQRELV